MPLIDQLREGLGVASQYHDMVVKLAGAQEALFRQSPRLPPGPADRGIGGPGDLATGPNGFKFRSAASDGPTQVVLVDPAGRPVTLGGGGGSWPDGGPRLRSASAASTSGATQPPYAPLGYIYQITNPDGSVVIVGPDGYPEGGQGGGLYGQQRPGAGPGGGQAATGSPEGGGGTSAPSAPPSAAQGGRPQPPYAALGYIYTITGPDGKTITVRADGFPEGGGGGLYGAGSSSPSGAAGAGGTPGATSRAPRSTGNPPYAALGFIYTIGLPDGRTVTVDANGYPEGRRGGLYGLTSPGISTAGGSQPAAGPSRLAAPAGIPSIYGPGFDSSGHPIPIHGASASVPDRPTPGETAIATILEASATILERIDSKLRTDPGAVSMRGPI